MRSSYQFVFYAISALAFLLATIEPRVTAIGRSRVNLIALGALAFVAPYFIISLKSAFGIDNIF